MKTNTFMKMTTQISRWVTISFKCVNKGYENNTAESERVCGGWGVHSKKRPQQNRLGQSSRLKKAELSLR